MKTFVRMIAFVAIAAFVALCAGCSKDNTEETPAPPPTVEPAPITITIREFAANSVKATIHPEKPELVYHSHIIGKKVFEKTWNNDVAAFLAGYIKYIAENNGITSQEVIDQMKTTGDYEFHQEGLNASTEYLIFAVGIDNDGKPTTVPVVKEFTTKPVVMLDCDFKLEVSNETITSAEVKITPSKNDIPYLSGAISLATSSWPSDKAQQKEFIQQLAWTLIEDAARKYAVELLDAIPYIAVKGEKVKQIEQGSLTPGTEYLAVAFGVDSYGNVNTDFKVKAFTTLPANASTNTFTVNIEKTAIGAVIDVTATNEDPYFVGVFPKATLGDATDAQIVASLVAEGAGQMTIQGSQQVLDWEEMLVSDTEYVTIVFGCDEWATTKVSRFPFKTDMGGNAADCNFNFTTSVNNFSLDFTVEPSDETVFYYCECLEKSKYPTDEQIIVDINKMMQDEIKLAPDLSVGEVLFQVCYRGVMSDMKNALPGEPYVLWAVAIDAKTGLIAGGVRKKEIVTPPRTISTATVSLVSSKYYDNKELNAVDPIKYPSEMNDYAFAKIKLGLSSNAVMCYGAIFSDNLTQKSDDVIIVNLSQYNAPLYGGAFETHVFFKDQLYFGSKMENTLCAVAVDADGNFGPVLKQLYVAEKSGVSPISDLVGKSSVVVPYRRGLLPIAQPAAAPVKIEKKSAKARHTVMSFHRNPEAEQAALAKQAAAAKQTASKETKAPLSSRAYGFSSIR